GEGRARQALQGGETGEMMAGVPVGKIPSKTSPRPGAARAICAALHLGTPAKNRPMMLSWAGACHAGRGNLSKHGENTQPIQTSPSAIKHRVTGEGITISPPYPMPRQSVRFSKIAAGGTVPDGRV